MELLIALAGGIGVGALVLAAEGWWQRNNEWITDQFEIPAFPTDMQLSDDALVEWGADLVDDDDEREILG